jgi:isopenicillin N synthase-like dioxygenase
MARALFLVVAGHLAHQRGPGERIWPPSVPGTFVINVGTMLASYSNDRVRMT